MYQQLPYTFLFERLWLAVLLQWLPLVQLQYLLPLLPQPTACLDFVALLFETFFMSSLLFCRFSDNSQRFFHHAKVSFVLPSSV